MWLELGRFISRQSLWPITAIFPSTLTSFSLSFCFFFVCVLGSSSPPKQHRRPILPLLALSPLCEYVYVFRSAGPVLLRAY